MYVQWRDGAGGAVKDTFNGGMSAEGAVKDTFNRGMGAVQAVKNTFIGGMCAGGAMCRENLKKGAHEDPNSKYFFTSYSLLYTLLYNSKKHLFCLVAN